MGTLAIAEIAGRDSVAAAVAATREHGFTRLLPTIALTGTETGDFDAPLRAVDTLERLLGESVDILEPVYLHDEPLWSAMNARFATTIQGRFGMCSACLACHLYMHLLRVPVSWGLGNVPVIAGERDTHDGRIKLSQTTQSIDAAVEILDYAGVALLQPIRHASGDDVAELVGGGWEEGGGQLGCLLSANYASPDGSVTYNEAAYATYLDEYLQPVGRAIVDAWRAQGDDDDGPAPDFEHIVADILVEARP
jgi:hypothetical protein